MSKIFTVKTDNENKSERCILFYLGHDTTASGISWILYCLAAHPDIQQRALQEIDDVVGASGYLQW